MASRAFRSVASLDTEEQILNGGAILAMIGFFFPWMGGEWLGGDAVTFSGFGFYTSYLGTTAFILLFFLILITVIPLIGGPILVKKRHRETVRLAVASAATLLILGTLSVLMKVTFEFSRMEMRYGIYVSLIGSLVAFIYALLRFQEQQKTQLHELFHHPEAQTTGPEQKEAFTPPPPPPPPPPPEPEEHRLYP